MIIVERKPKRPGKEEVQIPIYFISLTCLAPSISACMHMFACICFQA